MYSISSYNPNLPSKLCKGYCYGFNSMEKDDEVKGVGNSYDFGARMYDSRLGRWLSLDPQLRKQPSWSPCNAFLDNPVIFNDPDGESEFLTINYHNKQTGERFTMRLQISDEVRVRMNVQTGGLRFHDIEHSVNITVDAKGNTSLKTYFGEAGKDRGSWYTNFRADFRDPKFSDFYQKGGVRLISVKGEGTKFWTDQNVETLDLDQILRYIGALKGMGSKFKVYGKGPLDLAKRIKRIKEEYEDYSVNDKESYGPINNDNESSLNEPQPDQSDSSVWENPDSEHKGKWKVHNENFYKNGYKIDSTNSRKIKEK